MMHTKGDDSDRKSSGEHLNFTALDDARLKPRASICTTSTGGIGKAGRKRSYVAKVQGNGNLLVGKAYTAMLDLRPGDEFEIKLGRKQIRLVPVGGTDEDDA